MNIKEIAFQVLKTSYDHSKATGDIFLKTDDFVTQFNNYPENDLMLAFEYLNEKDYVEVRTYKGAKIPPFIKLKAAGYDWLNNDSATVTTVHQTFNFKDNYGAVGTNTDFTINNSLADFEQLSELIQQKTANNPCDKKELEEIRFLLKEIVSQGKPLPKGLLKRFSQTMQENSWLTGPMTTFLLKYLIS